MKKIISVFLTVIILSLSVVCASAVTVDLSDTGATIVTNGNWQLSTIEGGNQWEIYDYTGEDRDIIIPRIYNNMMITKIRDYCFIGDTAVKSVVTSSPLWTVGEYAFMNCTSLETFECNFALKEIGVGAFLGASSLRNINLENSIVTVIKPHAFSSCGISEIQLPETCTEIMHDAFTQCPNLKKIVIPASVTTIDDTAFMRSDNVTIYCYTDSAAHQFAVTKEIPFVLLDAEPPTEPPTEPKQYLLGDADTDGDVTILDATVIQRVLVGYVVNSFDEKAADVSVDGLDIVDATIIQRYLADMAVPYPVGEWVTYDA